MSDDNWHNKKAMQQKRNRQRIRGGGAGKGDQRRPTNESAYQLGLQLMKAKDQHGADSSEYKQAEKAWRAAVKKGL